MALLLSSIFSTKVYPGYVWRPIKGAGLFKGLIGTGDEDGQGDYPVEMTDERGFNFYETDIGSGHWRVTRSYMPVRYSRVKLGKTSPLFDNEVVQSRHATNGLTTREAVEIAKAAGCATWFLARRLDHASRRAERKAPAAKLAAPV